MRRDPRRVLVTGSAGVIGRLVCHELAARGHVVRGLDVAAGAETAETVAGSIVDADVVRRAMEGVEVVVHLAATPNEADFIGHLLPNNIVGLYRVLEGAAGAGVRRVILASSVQVLNGLRRPPGAGPVRLVDGTAPTNLYGASKVFAEACGRVYAARGSFAVLVARIGWLPRTPAEMVAPGARGWGPAIFLSHRDCARFFACAVETPFTGYSVVFATSRCAPGRDGLDPEPAGRVVGYEAADTYPEGLPPEFVRALT